VNVSPKQRHDYCFRKRGSNLQVRKFLELHNGERVRKTLIVPVLPMGSDGMDIDVGYPVHGHLFLVADQKFWLQTPNDPTTLLFLWL